MAGSSSSTRATVRQAVHTSARTGIVRAVALPLGPLLSDSQAALAGRRPRLHPRHDPEDSRALQPNRAWCWGRGPRRC